MPSRPSVSPAIAQMPAAPPSATARDSRNSVLRPPCPAGSRPSVTVVSPPDSITAGGCERLAVAADAARDARQHDAHLARLALQRIAQDDRREAPAARHLGHSRQRHHRCGDQAEFAVGQVCRLRRLVRCLLQPRRHRCGGLDAITGDDGARIGEGGGIRHRRPRGDHGGIVAWHVADRERHHARRSGGGGEPAALDGGEVLAHAVHFRNVRPAGEQRTIDRLLVGERQALGPVRRRAPSRRRISGPARDHRGRGHAHAPAGGARRVRCWRRVPDARPRSPRCAWSAPCGRSG